ncbi:MAG: polysaccharide pyruvyl transferase family protein [Bacteroides sp.]|uniref:polysaccharide pyruvyl transferase family protein n=1 Tax=Bacteroides sp. TaxID=29523 RepID=UPI002FCA4A73
MRIKTITCHDVYNYGAALQAYALQEYLISQGHDVEIIDYKPDYMSVHYKFWHVPQSSHYYSRAMKSNILRFMLCCYFAPKRFSTYGRKLKFDTFKKKYLRCTTSYSSHQQLVIQPPVADVYVAGSDQIWNCALPNGKDPSYFLQFGEDRTKRISYAASFAISHIPDEFKSQMRKWLSRFDAISVREHTGLSVLESLDISGTEVVDPVFLLSREQWIEFARRKRLIKNNYLLVYDLYMNDERLHLEAEKLSIEFQLQIVSVDGNLKCPYAQKNISDAGPQEFVNLIANAEYVITNSFHATAFSVIFNRPFAVFYKYPNISRIADVLNHVNLIHFLNTDTPSYKYNWDEVNDYLIKMRIHSYHFLSSNLR